MRTKSELGVISARSDHGFTQEPRAFLQSRTRFEPNTFEARTRFSRPRSTTNSLRNWPLGELTAREQEVLAEVAAGKSNAAIAASLFLTKRAVEKHINAIFMKLNLRESEDTSRRVTAALIYLADADSQAPPAGT